MRIWPRSLGAQLAVGVSLGVTLMWLATIAGMAFVIRHELDEMLDSALQETAVRLLPLATLELNSRELPVEKRINSAAKDTEYLSYVIRDKTGNIMLHSYGADLTLFDGSQQEGFRDTDTARIYRHLDAGSMFSVEVAEPHAQRQEAVFDSTKTMVMPIFVLVPLVLIGIVLFIRHALRPVTRFRDEIARRNGGDMRPVRSTDLPPEIASIADAVNGLLERLRRTIEAERSFTANSAHELRTPIAASLAQTQRLIAELEDAAPARPRALQVQAQLKRLSRLADKLMQLARAEGGGVVAQTAQDLTPILTFVVNEFHAAGLDGRLQLDLPKGPAWLSRLDPDAFGILARNLVENALIHGAQDAPVIVRLTPNGSLHVINGGPVVPAATLAQLTRRFTRGKTVGDGSGLGLAIADSIARGAGGELVLNSPAIGQADGFEAVFHPPPPPKTTIPG